MNYSIGTLMRLATRFVSFIFFAQIISACIVETEGDFIAEIQVENDTEKIIEIIGFPFPGNTRIFRDTVRVAPSELFTARGMAIREQPNFYDSVRIYWDDIYVRTDVNLGESSQPPSFFALYEIWSRFECGKKCDGYKLKASDLKLDEPEE